MANKLQWRFIAANLRALLTGQFSMPRGHLPPVGHRVPESFCGVGVATNPDPATDDAIIAALNDLGVKQVRLDFTYGDLDNHVARFLEHLLAEDFKVMLHILQPFEAARAMPSHAAEAQWRDFLIATLDRFGPRVEIVELCSTINRNRWAGYSLEGFLSAWRIGHEEIRKRNLVLAGPSITDFEPPWTIGILDLLAREGLRPDIHTDNLFAERATEPERWDHKALGSLLAPRVRFNLLKKARLLQRLGAHAGVPRMMSPAAFWTLPRIERMLPDSEQKQADYLSRYMVLCAASGAVARAGWGPLVCHREGLIDDGDHAYPRLERITHYASVTGTACDFRVRPAFHALAAFNRLIPGARYLGRHGHELEVHRFLRDDSEIHVIWTANALAAAACDVYSPADMIKAEWLDRDGNTLSEPPTLFSEALIYASWPKSLTPTLSPQARALPGLRIHRHEGKLHFYYRSPDWHGMVLASNRAEADILMKGLRPDMLQTPAKRADNALRHARNAIWTVTDPRDAHKQLVVKKPIKHHLHKKLLDRLKPSKAVRSWSGAAELLRRGVDTARPVAWFEARGDNLTENWFVCEKIEGGQSVGAIFSQLRSGKAPQRLQDTHILYEMLAAELHRLHDKGVFFRDLSGGNIMMRSGDKVQFALIDTARLRAGKPGSVNLRQRMADLVRACHKLSPPEQQTFIQCYFAVDKRPPPACVRYHLAAYALKTRLKRQIRKTAIYQHLKR